MDSPKIYVNANHSHDVGENYTPTFATMGDSALHSPKALDTNDSPDSRNSNRREKHRKNSLKPSGSRRSVVDRHKMSGSMHNDRFVPKKLNNSGKWSPPSRSPWDILGVSDSISFTPRSNRRNSRSPRTPENKRRNARSKSLHRRNSTALQRNSRTSRNSRITTELTGSKRFVARKGPGLLHVLCNLCPSFCCSRPATTEAPSNLAELLSSSGALDDSRGLSSSGALDDSRGLSNYGALDDSRGLSNSDALDDSRGLSNYGALDDSRGLSNCDRMNLSREIN